MGWLCRNCEAWHPNDNGRICDVCQEVRPPDLRAVPAPTPPGAPPCPAPPAFPPAVAPPPQSGRGARVAAIIAVLMIIIMVLRAMVGEAPVSPVPSVLEPSSAVPVVEVPARHIDIANVLCRPGQSVSCIVDLKNISDQIVFVRVQTAHGQGRTALALPDGTETPSQQAIAGDELYANVMLPPGTSTRLVVAFLPVSVPLPGMTFTLAWTESWAGGSREVTQSLLLQAVDEAEKIAW